MWMTDIFVTKSKPAKPTSALFLTNAERNVDQTGHGRVKTCAAALTMIPLHIMIHTMNPNA